MTLNEAREILLKSIPEAKVRPQNPDEWLGPFPLPEAVLAYYAEVGPVDLDIDAYGNPWYLPSLAELWNLQAGYGFHPDTKERFEDWSVDWLVVASEGGDPYIFDIRTETIFFDYHGRGFWKPEFLFRGLAEMVSVFAILGGVARQAGDALTDEHGIVTAYYLAAAESLERILDDRGRAVTILTSLGWEHQPNSPHAPGK